LFHLNLVFSFNRSLSNFLSVGSGIKHWKRESLKITTPTTSKTYVLRKIVGLFLWVVVVSVVGMVALGDVLRRIREAVYGAAEELGFRVWRVILFGSRARGDFGEGSDWDILVVVEGRLDRARRLELWYEIYRRLDVPADVIVVDKETFIRYKKYRGFIYRYALEEGVPI